METQILELGPDCFVLHRVRLASPGRVTAVQQVREAVALEPGLDATGALGRRGLASASAAVDRLLTHVRRKALGVPVLAIATPALASVRDASELVRVLRRRFGLTPWMLSTGDAARVSYRGARHDTPDLPLPGSVVHLGDSTIDFTAGIGATCDAAETITLGMARLHRAYGATDSGLLAADASALFSLVRLCAGPVSRRLREWGDVPMAAASPNVVTVLKIARALGYVEPGGNRIERVALHALAPEILAAEPERLEELGADRSLASLAGTTAVVLDAVADLLGQRHVRLATGGMVEGIALESWESEASLQQAAGAGSRGGYVPFTVA